MAPDGGVPPEPVADSPAPPAPDALEQPGVVQGSAGPEPAGIEPAGAEPVGTPPAALLEADAVAAEPAPDTGEMVVTAQRIEQDVQKTPVAVTALSTRAMEQRGVTNLQDMSKFTPNLQLTSTNRPAGGGSAYAAYIRGIGTGDFQFPTDPGVGLYLDDVYLARTIGGLLSIDADIQRIEVIKGPQGTLFGRNTIGGAFNITTQRPRLNGDIGGTVLIRLGEYGRKDFVVGINGPIVEDVIGAKLSVASLHLDGFGERLLDGVQTNSEERFIARGGVLFKLSDDLNIRIDADYSNQDQTPPAGQMLGFAPSMMTAAKVDKYNMFAAPALNPGLDLPVGSIVDGRWISSEPNETNALQPMYDRYDIGGVSGRITWSPEDWFNLKSVTALRVVSSDIAVDGDQTPYPLQSSRTELDDKQYSQELQLGGTLLNERLSYLIGLYLFRETGSSRLDTQSFHGLFENEPMPIPQDAGDTLTRFGLTATSYAAFTQETLTILPGLNLTAGARLNRDEKEYDYSVAFTQRAADQVPPSTAEAAWTSFTPKVGLDWSPIEPIMLYASYGQGFKSGGFSSSNNAMNPTPRYDPERVTAYEVGLKTHWFEGRRLTTNLAGFYNDYRDIQLTVQSVDPVTNANVRSTQNAGSSKIKGFEADVAATPVTGLVLNAGVGYVDARFDALSANAIGSGFALNDRLPQIPDWSIAAGAQYSFELGGAGELTVRGDLSYKGDQFLTPVDPSSYQPGYVLVSGRIAFVPAADEALEFALYGLNLADERYFVYRATLAPTGQEAGISGPPRMIFGTVKYGF